MFTFPVGFFGGTEDPYWNNVVLYLPLTGTNGQTTFTDVSQYGHAVTRNGDTVISTAQAPALTGVSSSAYFDGDGDWLTLPTSTFLDLGSVNDFTVEFFFRYLDTTWPYPVILGSGLASWTSGNWNITFDDTGFPGRVNKISLAMASGASLVTTNAFTIGTWHYAAFCRRSGQYEFWVNGTSEGTTSSLGGINLSGGRVGVAGHATDQRWYGNLSHLRVTKSVARDVSTVPTSPFPIG